VGSLGRQVLAQRDRSDEWRLRNLFIVVYIIIGLVVAWDRGYATLAWLKTLASAVLAVLLWWLVLLGINVHVH